jgi:predicted ABC-type ATPase
MLRLYLPLADDALLYDNSDGELTIVAERFDGADIVVHDRERWARIEEAGK